MKRFLAILLAMMLVLTMVMANVTAFAQDVDPATEQGGDEGNVTPAEGDATSNVVSIDPNSNTVKAASATPTKAVTVTIPKVITAEAEEQVYSADDKHPEVTLAFTVAAKSVELSTVSTAPAVTIESLKINQGVGTGDLKINLPSYAAVGIYTYTVTETATNIAGMTEAKNLELKVTIIQDVENNKLMIGGIAVRQDGTKTTEIENKYESGRLKVTKTVAGNLGDRTKEFPITITLNAPEGKTVASTVSYTINGEGDATTVTFSNDGTATVKVNLKHNDYVEIANLPVGVTYTVVEDNTITHNNAATDNPTNVNAYLVEGETKVEEGESAPAISAATLSTETITNTKEIEVDTGITLESVPYVLMMTLALVGFATLGLRKREDY